MIDPTAEDLADAVAARLGGPATLVIDAVGVNQTVADAFAASGLGSRIVLVGHGLAAGWSSSAYAVSTEERTLIGAFTYTADDFAETAAWVGTVPDGIEALIDGRVGWDGAPQSFDDLARGRSTASKILVFPHGPPLRRAARLSTPRIRQVRAYTVGAGGGADYHDQQGYHWIDDHIATPMSRYPEYAESRRTFGLNVLGTLVVAGRGRRRHRRLRRHHGRRARRVDRRAAPGPLPRGCSGHRHREDLGPDVSVHAVLRPQRPGAQRHQRRRPRPVRPAGPAAAGAGLPPARRRGPRRAHLLRHRRAARSGPADGLHRRQDAAAPRTARGSARTEGQPRPSSLRCGRRSATTSG